MAKNEAFIQASLKKDRTVTSTKLKIQLNILAITFHAQEIIVVVKTLDSY